jgi:hypothetical protein
MNTQRILCVRSVRFDRTQVEPISPSTKLIQIPLDLDGSFRRRLLRAATRVPKVLKTRLDYCECALRAVAPEYFELLAFGLIVGNEKALNFVD